MACARALPGEVATVYATRPTPEQPAACQAPGEGRQVEHPLGLDRADRKANVRREGDGKDEEERGEWKDGHSPSSRPEGQSEGEDHGGRTDQPRVSERVDHGNLVEGIIRGQTQRDGQNRAVVTQDHEGGGETCQKTDVGQGIVDEGWRFGERERTNGEPSKGDEPDANSDIREDAANDGEEVRALDPHRDQSDERDGHKGAFLGEEPRCESGEGCHGPESFAGRRIGGPSEACQHEEGEEAGENLGAPRNVGNGFRVHRVNGEEQRGHPGRGGGP